MAYFNANILMEKLRFIRHYSENKAASSKLSYDSVFSLYEDDNKNIWVGTFGGGLNKLTLDSARNPQKNRVFPKK